LSNRKQNSSKGETSGFGEVDNLVTPPGPVYTNPGARNGDPDWVRKDMLYKSQLPQQKFY